MEIKLICDTRERKIQDNINTEFSAPLVFAKSAKAGKISCEVRQIDVGDYIITRDNAALAVIERKSLTDYAASFKDGRHTNKAKLLNFSSLTGCKIYYVIEGPLNPEYDTEYAGIKFQNIQASIHDLMIEHGIIILRTQNGAHTAKELKMLCESYLRVSANDLAKSTRIAELPTDSFIGDQIAKSSIPSDLAKSDNSSELQYVHPIDNPTDSITDRQNAILGSSNIPVRHAISFEEALKKSVLTPEEELCKARVFAWKTLPRVGEPTAAKLAEEFALSDWITGNLDQAKVQAFTFNGRKNSAVTNLLSAKPSIEMQANILAELKGFTAKSAVELLLQVSLEDILLDKPTDHVRLGNRKTRFTVERKAKIKLFLSGKN